MMYSLSELLDVKFMTYKINSLSRENIEGEFYNVLMKGEPKDNRVADWCIVRNGREGFLHTYTV